MPCEEFGCSSEWSEPQDCGGGACVIPHGKAFCALSATPSPECAAASGSVCVGDTVDFCHEGYLVG